MIIQWLSRHKLCILICACLIFVNLYSVRTYAQENEIKNILILNSYQDGLSWTDHEVHGIVTALYKSDLNYSIDVEFMDWKNYPTKENLDNIYSDLSYKYSNKHLDMVITTDDAALEFSLANRNKLFADTPIVFCGVNQNGVSQLVKSTKADNVTGVVEEVDAERTIQAAMKINPKLSKVYVIYDTTESGRSTGELTIQAIKKIAPKVKIISLNRGKYEEILNQVEQVQNNSAILITTYYKDEEGSVVGFEDFCEMVSEKSHVPVYHLYEFGLNHGAIGGSMLFGDLQGKKAGEIAVKILHGTNIYLIPIDRRDTTRYVFDYNQLDRFHISLDKIPSESQVLNKPFSFIKTYRNLVITVSIIICLLISLIFVLILHVKRINRMKHKLHVSNVELTNLYDELTASDEELKQQFDELVITQKSLMESEERYALLFEKMLNGFFVFEPIFDQNNNLLDMLFLSVNPSFEYHTKRQVNRVIGKTWSEVFGVQNPNMKQYEKVLDSGIPVRFETYYANEKSYYLVNAFRIKHNQVGVVIDNITDYKKAIKEVGKLNEELEQRVIERTNDLQHAVKELESFAYTVSHDLKSPLRAVDGYSKIILEDYEKELNEDTITMLSMIRSTCSEMIDMINKLLQYSTTSRISLNIETVDSNDLFRTVFQELRSTYPDRRIELRIETGLPDVNGDRILLRQAFYNILSNAIKFTKDREISIITIGASITDNYYIFYVKDNGVGFDMAYSQKLFSLFQRLHTSDEFEGSGIGLITIKKIIERHGGRTWIEGIVDQGATLFFTLPIEWNQE